MSKYSRLILIAVCSLALNLTIPFVDNCSSLLGWILKLIHVFLTVVTLIALGLIGVIAFEPTEEDKRIFVKDIDNWLGKLWKSVFNLFGMEQAARQTPRPIRLAKAASTPAPSSQPVRHAEPPVIQRYEPPPPHVCDESCEMCPHCGQCKKSGCPGQCGYCGAECKSICNDCEYHYLVTDATDPEDEDIPFMD